MKLMIYKNKMLMLVFVSLFTIYNNCNAQEVTIETQSENKNVLVGDEIKIKNFIIFNPNEVKINLPNIPDTFNHFEILTEIKIDTIQKDNETTLIQHLSLINFDSGRWEIPNFTFTIFPKDGSNSYEDTTQKVWINVTNVAVDTTNKQLPFFDIIEAEKPFWEKIKNYIFSVIVLILLIIVFYLYKKWRNKNSITPEIIIPKITPKEKALLELNKIAQQYSFPITELKKYYTEISDVLRSYLESQFDMETFEKTSTEIISTYKKIVQKERGESGFDGLRNLLITSDNVKFAKGKPSEIEIEQAIEVAQNVIEKSDAVYKKLNQQPKNESN